MAWKTKLAELLVEIKAPLGPLKTAMSKAAAIVKRGMKSMSRWARRGAVAIGVGLAGAMVWAAKKAMIQEDAEIALTAALRATGDATETNIARLKRYASELQKLTIYGDEEILAQMAYAKNLGVTTDKLEDAAKAAIGLAATYKLDLKAAMMLVGRASQGQTQMLTRYGIVLRAGLTDQQKFNEVLRIGAKGFALAEERARSNTGTLTKLWNVIGDIAEAVGAKLLERLMKVVDATKLWVDANKELIATRIGEWVDKLVSGLEKLAPVLGFVTKYWKVFIGILAALAVAPGIVAIARIVKVLAFAGAAIVKFGIAAVLTMQIISKYVRTALLMSSSSGKAVSSFLRLQKALKAVSKTAWWVASKILRVIYVFKTWIAAIKAASAAAIALGTAVVAGIAVIIVQVVLLVRALWQIHAAKKKIAAHEKAATKEEIANYKKKVRAIKDEASEKRKAAKEAKKAASAASLAARKARADAELKLETARLQAIEDAAKREAELDKIRQDGIDKLEKQLEMYKEMVGFEKEIAAIEGKLRKERARDIAKELGMGGVGVLDNLELKQLREKADEQKRIDDEAAQALRDKKTERQSLYRDELSALEALFTDAKGYEKQLADVRARIRKNDAKDIAKLTKVGYEDALKILSTKEAVASVKIGMTGFEQAWGQIATGASQTEKEIAKSTKETARHTKTIAEKTTIIAEKRPDTGFGP